MNNHTEILVNVLKSVAYDDNWASQHKNAHLNQLRNKSQTVAFIFWCIAILTSEQDPVQKMHFRPENNCSKAHACEVYIFKVWVEDRAGLLPSF